MKASIPILWAALVVTLSPAAQALEQGAYDSAGKLTGLIHDGSRLDVRGGFVVRFEGGVDVEMQPHDQRSPVTRAGLELQWTGTATFPNGRSADFAVSWKEDAKGVAFGGGLSHAAANPLHVQSIEYVIDVPRALFVNGHMASADDNETLVGLPATKTAQTTLYSDDTQQVEFRDANRNWSLGIRLDGEHPVLVEDRWDEQGRAYRVRIQLFSGLWPADTPLKFGMRLVSSGKSAAADALLNIDPRVRLYAFDGFGGNYCWAADNAVTQYTLRNLRLAWSRHELKAIAWDRERKTPGDALKADFERIAHMQKAQVPWIISLWRVPERFYIDANRHQPGTFGRKIVPERWDEMLELIGSYLQYIKQEYGAEPALFSFNEPDLGVDIGLSPVEHRDAIKRIGSYLRKQGFKTRMLLGDTANPRDTHEYILPTTADPEAMQYVGAVSFHSWGNGSPAQYAAWSDVAQWLQLPLLIGEAGVDPGAYRNRNYDSYDYGLKELEQLQNLLRYARPQSSLYWQFTEDYGLARPTGSELAQPTGRFWMMKHFTNLTPPKSEAVQSASDQDDVLISAFTKSDRLAVHIVNIGPARRATLKGLPSGRWRRTVTTESQDWDEQPLGSTSSLQLPARSVTTLVSGS
ncbi:MAG TPA: hypothetical protein VIT67_01725 [Povalibacter sp.]